MIRTLLLTAFEPFGGETRNAALDAVRTVPEYVGGWRVVKLTVPTVFGESIETVTAAIERERPDAVLLVGQAGSRDALTPERVAVNRIDARIPDNAGRQPVGMPVVQGGPETYGSTLPIEEMTGAIQAAGIPARVSDDAGRFVCNQLFYGVMYYLRMNKLSIPAGFLHVPRATEQTNGALPSLPLAQIADGVTAAISEIAVACF